MRSGNSTSIGNDIGDRLRQLGVMCLIDVMRTGNIAVAQRSTKSVGKIGEVRAGDKSVLKRLLLLLREGKQSGLLYRAGLDAACHFIVRLEGRLAFGGVRQYSDWREPLEYLRK